MLEISLHIHQEENTEEPLIIAAKNKHSIKLQEYMLQNISPPDLYKMTNQELQTYTQSILQISKIPGKQNQENAQLYSCPTCTYKSEHKQHLTQHRKMNKKCKQEWEQEQKQGWTCINSGCHQNFTTEKALQEHNYHHCHEQTQKEKQLKITATKYTKTKTIDRRKQHQNGTPPENTPLYNNNIKYDVKKNQRACQLCPKHYGPKSMRNAIQHAHQHIRNTQKPTKQHGSIGMMNKN